MDHADQLQQRFRLLRQDAALRPDPFPGHVPDGAGQFSWPTQRTSEKTGLYFEALRDQEEDATNDLKAAVNQTDKALAVLRARKSKILDEKTTRSRRSTNSTAR